MRWRGLEEKNLHNVSLSISDFVGYFGWRLMIGRGGSGGDDEGEFEVRK